MEFQFRVLEVEDNFFMVSPHKIELSENSLDESVVTVYFMESLDAKIKTGSVKKDGDTIVLGYDLEQYEETKEITTKIFKVEYTVPLPNLAFSAVKFKGGRSVIR